MKLREQALKAYKIRLKDENLAREKRKADRRKRTLKHFEKVFGYMPEHGVEEGQYYMSYEGYLILDNQIRLDYVEKSNGSHFEYIAKCPDCGELVRAGCVYSLEQLGAAIDKPTSWDMDHEGGFCSERVKPKSEWEQLIEIIGQGLESAGWLSGGNDGQSR